MIEKTPLEWLSERYNYINWLRNRDEISAGVADKLRESSLEEAKVMEEFHLKGEFIKLLDSMIASENVELGKLHFLNTLGRETHANNKYCLAIVKSLIEGI